MKLVIITGVNKGLGKALLDLIREQDGFYIWAISRRLNDHQKENTSLYSNVKFILQDLSNITDMSFLDFENNKISFEEIIFINNAAAISPIGNIGSFTNDEIRNNINLNTIAPLLISNKILKCAAGKFVKIVNISSGAAQRPIEGWGLYCATKSANEMFFNVLDIQTDKNHAVFNVDPGVMDTDMQQEIRGTSSNQFPGVSRFLKLKSENKLQKTTDVALRILNQCSIL